MHKKIYRKITIDDNMMLIVQALIDKQGEIIDWINGLSDSNRYSPQFLRDIQKARESLKNRKTYSDKDLFPDKDGYRKKVLKLIDGFLSRDK